METIGTAPDGAIVEVGYASRVEGNRLHVFLRRPGEDGPYARYHIRPTENAREVALELVEGKRSNPFPLK